jgi:hypothetical protein
MVAGTRKPGVPNRVIRDERFDPRRSLVTREALVAQKRVDTSGPDCTRDPDGRVVTDYFPRKPQPAGDPSSPSGVKVELSELADDVLAAISSGGGGVRVREVDGSPDIDPTTIITVPNDTLTLGGPEEAILDFNAFELREVVLTFSASVAPGTVFNIQTGVYAGAGSPAMVMYDTDVTLPASGAAFAGDGRIEVMLNGQDLKKGASGGAEEANWASSTQLSLAIRILPGNQVTIRAPFPTA